MIEFSLNENMVFEIYSKTEYKDTWKIDFMQIDCHPMVALFFSINTKNPNEYKISDKFKINLEKMKN